MKIGYYLFNSSKNGFRLGKNLDIGRQVGQKWPQKIRYHMWMAPKIPQLLPNQTQGILIDVYILLSSFGAS